MTLSNERRIVVIGGSSGIGLGITRLLCEQGAQLTITGRTRSSLEAAQRTNQNVREIAAFDFTDEGSVKSFFDTVDEFDDLVVVAAGAPRTGLFLERGSLANIRDYIDQKLWGVMYAARYGIPKIKPTGSIIFFVGDAGRRAFPGRTALAIVNTAIVGFAKTLAVEIKPIRVNVICLGVVATHAWDHMPETQRQALFASLAAANPRGRLGTPRDVAEAVSFLLTADYVNGIVLDVLGGESVDFMH